jgi:hypothetical protein
MTAVPDGAETVRPEARAFGSPRDQRTEPDPGDFQVQREKLDHKSRQEGEAIKDKIETRPYFEQRI